MAMKIGPREMQLRALRERNFEQAQATKRPSRGERKLAADSALAAKRKRRT